MPSKQRLYVKKESQVFTNIKNIQQYRFKIIKTQLIDRCEDWVVAGISFNDEDHNQQDNIFDIYVYHFREGFCKIQVSVKIVNESKQIQINFQKGQMGKEKAPKFSQEAGDKFLINIFSSLAGEFNQKNYEKGKIDLYNLIERLQWASQLRILNQQKQKHNIKNLNIAKYLVIAIPVALLGLIIGYKAIKK